MRRQSGSATPFLWNVLLSGPWKRWVQGGELAAPRWCGLRSWTPWGRLCGPTLFSSCVTIRWSFRSVLTRSRGILRDWAGVLALLVGMVGEPVLLGSGPNLVVPHGSSALSGGAEARSRGAS